MYLRAQMPITMLAEKVWLSTRIPILCFLVVRLCIGANPKRTHACTTAAPAQPGREGC